MTPPAFLALWNGVLPGWEAEYEAWHSQEHAPERLGAPGFRAARRYRAEAGAGYFTLYELEGLEALDTPAYMALVREPTLWSARMRPTLTDFRRLPCQTLAGGCFGRGGALATLRLPGQGAPEAVRAVAERAMAEGALLGFLLGEAARLGQSYEAFPQARPPEAETLLVLEASEAGLLPPAVEACRQAWPVGGGEAGFWRALQFLRREELPDPSLERQPPRDTLRRHWLCAAEDIVPEG
ncbi:hypothetical protein NON00_10410 [Roseomonas sp. GC11]|uniref:DUF4286 family protein n=1 Tax=Roseomonas sp. GC11 TaxID=2950546 RepID=UPI0021088C80|nr:DUF4286 family protein [Roseomonas sp. GC11]MCQ4160339.1 hypothetical protein [Roseomonas sp. GC11]